MNIRLNMCNLYFRDKVKERGWERVDLFHKTSSLLITLWEKKEKILNILVGKYNYLRQVELVLTTGCSLRCKECANLMQYYKKPYMVAKEQIETSINNLQQCVDEINKVVLVGGEPFLYKDISEIISYVAKFQKVNYIDIFTNGTIVPSENNIYALQNNKVKIIVSDYGEISRRKYELKDFCEKNNIRYYLKNDDLYWGYVGDMNSRKRTKKQLSRQFRNCHNYCRSILNGKLFYCPRAAHGDDLGYVNAGNGEYVDLTKDNTNTKQVLKLVYSNHFFLACDYCNYGTKEMIAITPGIQVQSGEKEDYS